MGNTFWNILYVNQDHIWYALAGIGAGGTLFVALRALRTWRAEKEYDLTVENLTLCNSAVNFICNLRSPVSLSGEISQKHLEQLNELAELDGHNDEQTRRAAMANAAYESRRDHYQPLLEQISKLREKDWAVYGVEHDFFMFYDKILALDREIRQAYIRYYYTVKDREEPVDQLYKDTVKGARKVMYNLSGEKDQIEIDLRERIERLQKHRKPMKRSIF